MAVLETIRVKLGILITVLIAVALLSFIIDPNTLQSVSSSMSSKYDVGNIDGKAISYNDFQADVEKFTTINEIISGSSVSSEQQHQAVRNAAWQSLVDKYLFVKNAQAAGETTGKKAYYKPGKERSKLEKKVKKAEEELEVKEAKLEELKVELLKPEYQSSYSKLTEIQNEIDAMEEEIMEDMENWEALSQELEALEA